MRFAEKEPMGRNTTRSSEFCSHVLSLRCLEYKLIIADFPLSADNVSDKFEILSPVLSAA